MRNIGIQLYMVRHALRRDFLGVLEQLAAIGYRGVEFFGDFGGYAPQVLRAHLAAIGLTPIGGHCRIEDVQGDALQRTLEHFAALGASYVGVGWVPERFRTAEGWREAARIMERAGQAAQRYGLTFYYHNHDFEFERLDGHYAIDILFGAADNFPQSGAGHLLGQARWRRPSRLHPQVRWARAPAPPERHQR